MTRAYNARIVTGGAIIAGGCLEFDAETGKILGLHKSCTPQAGDLDCKGALLLPGAIDSHVHFRDPGQPQKEDFGTGSRGAIAGGVTTVIDMPNNSPPIDSIGRLDAKIAAVAPKAVCDYSFYFGGGKANQDEAARAAGHAAVAGLKIYMGSSTGDLLADSAEAAYGHFAKFDGKPIAVHAEEEGTIQLFTKLCREAGDKRHNRARPPFAAPASTARALALCEATGKRLHVVHASTQAETALVEIAKQRGMPVTLEACPHHLFLNDKDQERLGALGKMNPPLRDASDQAALWRGLNEGLIDTIATDHAPHTLDEKNADYFAAPSGVPGVQTMMPLLLTAALEGKTRIETIVKAASENPARIFGFGRKGLLQQGFDADFVLYEEKEWTVRGVDLESRCGWTPFEGMTLKARPSKVFLRGKLAYEDGQITAKPGDGMLAII